MILCCKFSFKGFFLKLYWVLLLNLKTKEEKTLKGRDQFIQNIQGKPLRSTEFNIINYHDVVNYFQNLYNSLDVFLINKFPYIKVQLQLSLQFY